MNYYVYVSAVINKGYTIVADSKEEAAQNIQNEHWNIASIDMVSEL